VSNPGYLVGVNPKRYKIQIEAEDCGRFCTTEKEWCKSFDYGLITKHCNLYTVSYFDTPAATMISDWRAANKFVHYEIFTEAPSRVPGACTHYPSLSGEYTMVQECKVLDKDQCFLNAKCEYNFLEYPSNEPGKCTHIQSESGNEVLVKYCKDRTY
jgi:hypothetical protein